AKEFAALRAEGALVIDARDPQEFAAGHVRGSLNVPIDGRFAETAGSVASPDRTLLVIAPQDREEEVITRLARIGFDRVAGYLREPDHAFLEMIADLSRASRLTVPQLREVLEQDEPPVVLDVRNA